MSMKQEITGKSPAMPPSELPRAGAITNGNGTTAGDAAATKLTAAAETGGSVTVTGSLTANGTMTVSGDLKIVGMIESEFLKQVREIFFKKDENGKQIWPPDDAIGSSPASRKRMSHEFTDAFDALFMREEGLDDPTGGPPGSALALVKQLIDATNWPIVDETDATHVPVPVPDPWNTGPRQLAFRRYEVSCAMDILMRAFRSKGTGTGGENTGLPPDR